MLDWSEYFRPRKFNDVIGQSHLKPIIHQNLVNNKYPRLSIFSGPSGTGKSTLAEMVAMTLACKNSNSEPCCECDNCKAFLENRSRIIKKYNMAKLLQKSEAVDIMHQIFDYESIDGLSVFILEEIHELPASSQAPFLEELTKIPEDVYIIMCTTKPYKIIEEMRGRAITFNCELPSVSECKEYIKRVCRIAGITMPSNEAMSTLIDVCEYNPREIIKNLQLFSSSETITVDLLIEFYGLAPLIFYVDLLEKLLPSCTYPDYFNFLSESLDSNLTAVKIVKGFSKFITDVLLVNSSKKFKLIGQADRLKEICDKLGEHGLLSIVEFIAEKDYKSYANESGAKFFLLSLKLKLCGNKVNSRSVATMVQIESENKARARIAAEENTGNNNTRMLTSLTAKSLKQNGTNFFTEED